MHNKIRIPTNKIKGFKMNKVEFINRMSEISGTTKKDAKIALESVLGTIAETLAKGESVQFVGFGSFNVKDRAAREATVPGTTRKVQVPASKAVSFKTGKDLKNTVNGK